MEGKKDEKMNFYLDNYPLKKLYFMDLSKDLWKNFNPTESLFSKKNHELMYRLSEELKEVFLLTKNDEIATNEIKKLKWLIISPWDFFKESPPKFDALLFAMNNNRGGIDFINPFKKENDEFFYQFKDPCIWKEKNYPGTNLKNIFSDYSKWIFDVFNKKRKRIVHFWDFLHSFKRFIWPYVITKESYSTPLEELNKDLVRIIVNDKIEYKQDIDKKIETNCLWDWRFFKDIVDEGEEPKNVFERILRGYYKNLGEGVGAKYIYEFPIILNTEKFKKDFLFQSVATVSFAAVEPINYAFWEYLIYCYLKSYLQIFLPSSFIARFKVNSLKSAIAAIMSRNASHNIGSHVLVSLSSESINAADDRVLFKYLQQRMDYIAQASTELPTWSSPVWFISDLMKRFYMQKHLLEYIGKSEGLGVRNWKNKKETGKIVLKIKNANDGKYIITDSDEDELNPKLDDFQLAIPGGIVGLHAFYNILENIIRNAAKHNWQRDPLENTKNLEIIIEFENNTDEELVTFRIYDSVSINKKDKISLHEKMNNIFSTDFIEESGKLRKENWGLAEMRISAGYLNHKTYQDIGLHKVGEDAFIKAVPGNYQDTERLAYEFKVPKPKDLLIVGDNCLLKDKKNLKNSGIYVEEELDDQPYEHEIVVIFENALNGKYDSLESMPGRIFIVKTNDEPDNIIKTMSDVLGIAENVVRRKIVILERDRYNGLKGNLNREEENEDFKINLYLKWVENLVPGKESFYLNLEGRDENSISDYLDEQMSLLIKSHVIESDFLKEECDIHGSDLENIRDKFNQESFQTDNFIHGKCTVCDDEFRNEEIKQALISKKNILKHLIFRDDDRIDTVPEQLKNPGKKNRDTKSWRSAFRELNLNPRIQLTDEANEKDATVCYKRHIQFPGFNPGKPGESDAARESDTENKYVESLSGSQFYFTMLYDSLTSRDEKLDHRKKKIILQLIENAALKCVIIDERAARFLSSSDILKQKFKYLRIKVPFYVRFQDKKEVRLIEDLNQHVQTFSDENLDGCDILIIHQGILDKMGLSDKKKAGEFLREIKEKVPFVFITSGRGKPDNVPDNVKFLPFSSVDSFLLKEYPEKLLLIQSAMKLNLPKNGGSK